MVCCNAGAPHGLRELGLAEGGRRRRACISALARSSSWLGLKLELWGQSVYWLL